MGRKSDVGLSMETMVFSCLVCDEDTEFGFVEAERGDRFQPGWDACWQCTKCDEYNIDLWELDND